jgi:hypothetical protein
MLLLLQRGSGEQQLLYAPAVAPAVKGSSCYTQ